MAPPDEVRESGTFTIRRLAHLLGCSPENIRALERRGRLPQGCEPSFDEITGTRYWTAEQARVLKEWNDERTRKSSPDAPEAADQVS